MHYLLIAPSVAKSVVCSAPQKQVEVDICFHFILSICVASLGNTDSIPVKGGGLFIEFSASGTIFPEWPQRQGGCRGC